jgi:hypothetical protein
VLQPIAATDATIVATATITLPLSFTILPILPRA